MFSSLMLMVLDQLMVFLVLVELLETGLVIGLKVSLIILVRVRFFKLKFGVSLLAQNWRLIFISKSLRLIESDSTSCCCQPYKFH